MKIYSILDTVSNAYQNPIYSVNDGSAIRIFSEAVNDPQTYLNKAPHDYILYSIGEFEPTTGCIISQEVPQKLIHGNEVVDTQRVTASNQIAEQYLKEIKSILEQKA